MGVYQERPEIGEDDRSVSDLLKWIRYLDQRLILSERRARELQTALDEVRSCLNATQASRLLRYTAAARAIAHVLKRLLHRSQRKECIWSTGKTCSSLTIPPRSASSSSGGIVPRPSGRSLRRMDSRTSTAIFRSMQPCGSWTDRWMMQEWYSRAADRPRSGGAGEGVCMMSRRGGSEDWCGGESSGVPDCVHLFFGGHAITPRQGLVSAKLPERSKV